MKSMIAVLAVAVLLFSPGLATADDKDDVIAAMLDYISGWNDGDAAKIAQYMLPDATAFNQGGGGTGGVRHASLSAQNDVMSDPEPTAG